MTELSGHAPPAVYRAIARVAGAIAKEGISKDRRNSQQGYNFRGIDDVYNALAPHLSEAGLVVLPRVLARIETERQTKSGGALFNVVVEVEFDFVAAEDGSSHTVKTFGEAMDSADKATNKAMSAAYKYAAMQAFCIPTDGDNDADGTTHSVAPTRQNSQHQAPTKQQQKAERANDDARITQATAVKRCQEAGLTPAGIAAMAQELSKGETFVIGCLSPDIQRKLATAGVSDASVKKWNAAGAALTANDATEADDDPDLPATWDVPTAA